MPVYLPGLAFGVGYGGASYGTSPYGSGAFPRLPVPVTGGFGGASYGTSSYGSVDITPPKITGARSLDGYRIEVFFSEAIRDDAALYDVANWTLVAVYGKLPVVSSVSGSTPGAYGGWTSVILSHDGTTLGGSYTVSATGLQDLAGNLILVTTTGFLAFGDETTYTVGFPSPDDGKTLVLDFVNSLGSPQALLTEAEFSPGVDDLSSYGIESPSYPLTPTLSSPQQDPTLLSRVTLGCQPMTSAVYNFVAGPSLSLDYTGTVLPDDDPNFNGVEVGTGSSTVSAGLFLTKALADTYGWEFLDTTGRVVPGSSYRIDVTLDENGSAGTGDVASIQVSDGVIGLSITLNNTAGIRTLRVDSGALSLSAPAEWSASTVSLVRNQKGSFYSVLLDGEPLLTWAIASATGVPTLSGPGAGFFLLPGNALTLFKVGSVEVTASSTLYTSAWNFIHRAVEAFTGSAVLTRDRIKTKYGPLVRGWGDATPATKEDVEVRLDGTALPLSGVNPYVGEIYPEVPIPLAPAGTFTVDVDYIWFSNPAMGMLGLNTRGLGLNIWDRAVGHTPGSLAPVPASATGATKNNRFPMGVVLTPYTRPSPKLIGHRYIGFQKGGYSALLNEPTTLRINQNPHAISTGRVNADAYEESAFFDGTTSPDASEPPWSLDGVDGGSVVGDGTYRVVDASSGPYGVGTAAIWKRDLDLSLPSSYTGSARLKIESYTADGVFTGVGFGVHDGGHLLLVGALIVDGVQHVGLLTDGDNPHLEASWVIGPTATMTAVDRTTLTLATGDLPPGFGSGSRFRVASGPQAGVYEAAECGVYINENGLVEVVLTSELPADPGGFEAGEFEAIFETIWDTNLVSIRFQSDFPGGSTQAYIGGSLSGLIGSLPEAPAYPAQTALLLPATKEGVAFWGSVSRRAESTSVWDLSQYYSFPERALQTVQGLSVLTEMEELPQDASSPWYIVGGFGESSLTGPGSLVRLKATSAPETDGPDLAYSYARVEPFYQPRTSLDLEASLRVEHGRLGAQDVEILLDNGQRRVCFTPLLYVQDSLSRALVTDLPQGSLSGLQEPVTAGWTATLTQTLSLFVRGQTYEITKTATQEALWEKELPAPGGLLQTRGLIHETRLQVVSGTAGSAGIGVLSGVSVRQIGNIHRQVWLGLDGAGVVLYDSALNAIANFPFAYGTEAHDYKISADPDANIVVVSVDDIPIGSEPLTSFQVVTGLLSEKVYFGGRGTGACEVRVHSTYAVPLRVDAIPGAAIGRTFGILLRGGDPADIDGYRIPRADSTQALNSSLTAVPVQMDWQSTCQIRLYHDPEWGITFYRPDLPPPPWAGPDWATQSTNPSDGWATVEYRDLPVSGSDFRASVAWGSPNPDAVAASVWDYFRYRIRGDIDGFGIAPQNMVLNRAFTFTSDEFLRDTAPEVRTITSRTRTLVVVSDSAIFADRIFVVQVDGAVVPSTDWSFNPEGQLLSLSTALPSVGYPVTVTFAAGRPVTKEFLCDQPLENSGTLLNEGTPPVVLSRDEPWSTAVTAGTPITPPPPTDPYEYIKFEDGPDSLYASVETCEVEDGDSVHISPLCDGPGPGLGLAEIALEGLFTSEAFSKPEGPGGPWGSASPVIKGSASRFNQSSILLASGGSYVDGVLGPGTAILYPNGRGPGWEPLPVPGPTMGMNQDFRMILEDVTVREETLDIPSLLGDNTPPSSPNPADNPNPDGVPSASGYGAAAYELEDYSSSPFSRLGPWSGLAYLGQRSLLGGGAQLDGTQFTLMGGNQLPIIRTVTTGVIEHP